VTFPGAHQPIRTCMGCRERHPQAEMIRLRQHKDGVAVVNKDGPAEGRSIYLCPRESCWVSALRRGRLIFKAGKYDRIIVYLDARDRDALMMRLRRTCREAEAR
jgi:predicted RNA-binding protein YlxR (DUF448 family)